MFVLGFYIFVVRRISGGSRVPREPFFFVDSLVSQLAGRWPFSGEDISDVGRRFVLGEVPGRPFFCAFLRSPFCVSASYSK